MLIDMMKLDKYELIALETEEGYKKLIQRLKMEEDNAKLMDEIAATAGGSKIGMKL